MSTQDFGPRKHLGWAMDKLIFEDAPYTIGIPGKVTDSHEFAQGTATKIINEWLAFLAERNWSSLVKVSQDRAMIKVELSEVAKDLLLAHGFSAFRRTSADGMPEVKTQMTRDIRELFNKEGL